MTIVGRYVSTFAEASHALPEGMHMNADYPFMLPRIAKLENGTVTLEGRAGKTASFTIEKQRGGAKEIGHLEQSSSFEALLGRKPTRFLMLPFKDEHTPAISQGDAAEPIQHGSAK